MGTCGNYIWKDKTSGLTNHVMGIEWGYTIYSDNVVTDITVSLLFYEFYVICPHIIFRFGK